MTTKTLDAKGLNCPLPILKTKQTLSGMAGGDTLEVLCTDPGSVEDFQAFCRATGNELLEQGRAGEAYRYVIERRA
ncbi:sulfurtransferase TusA family protein [Qipengyuania sp. 6B39]|uniref:sulfurtransferase TusA family protein n=1 Tax=Qipengyuania proteolytica TaxID=2867239 RepID=UPI001C8A400C|nr:sulfurtransferase TusA family protein [Qipengyuania proteolytica]MBX7496307.1 sulfurtransferase TusA family protein [Qipengyuania proteolytica]